MTGSDLLRNSRKTDAEMIAGHPTLAENQAFFERKKAELSGRPVVVNNENLLKYPRPSDDNRRGLHWSTNPSKWGKDRLEFWLNEIKGMNLKWVKLFDTGSGTCFELAMRLVDLEIMPVVRMYTLYPHKFLNWDVVKRYVDIGVVWFEFGNEPDLALEWERNAIPEGWLNIVVERFVEHARQCRNLGGYTLFDAFGQGTRVNPFEKIVEKGGEDLFDGYIGLALHNYCLGRPLSYPNDPIRQDGRPYTRSEFKAAGGFDNQYAFTQPYESVNRVVADDYEPDITIMDDATCFRAYEYFSTLLKDVIGDKKIPIMTTEGGYNTLQIAEDAKYPKLDPFLTSVAQKQMLDFINLYAPEEYFACMPWFAGAEVFGYSALPYESQGPYYTGIYQSEFELSDKLPIVDKLKNDPGRIHARGKAPDRWQEIKRYQEKIGDRQVDPRLFLLPRPVLVEPYAGDGSYWKIIKVEWRNKGEPESSHRLIFCKLLDEAGNPLENAEFAADRGDAIDTVRTKGPVDGYWGNAMMTGPLGTYTVYVTEPLSVGPEPPTEPEPPVEPEPPPSEWTYTLTTGSGLGLLVGDIGLAGKTVAVTRPGGWQDLVTSGSKAEHGPGGFETYAQSPGTYVVEFLDQRFELELTGQFTKVIFRPVAGLEPPVDPEPATGSDESLDETGPPSDLLTGVGLGALVESELKLTEAASFFITFQRVLRT